MGPRWCSDKRTLGSPAFAKTSSRPLDITAHQVLVLMKECSGNFRPWMLGFAFHSSEPVLYFIETCASSFFSPLEQSEFWSDGGMLGPAFLADQSSPLRHLSHLWRTYHLFANKVQFCPLGSRHICCTISWYPNPLF